MKAKSVSVTVLVVIVTGAAERTWRCTTVRLKEGGRYIVVESSRGALGYPEDLLAVRGRLRRLERRLVRWLWFGMTNTVCLTDRDKCYRTRGSKQVGIVIYPGGMAD